MQRFEHGGNIYRHQGVLDFSANLNPLGIPSRATQALAEALDSFDVYPDPDCLELTQAIAAFEHVPQDWVLPCAGATDALSRLCLALRPERGLVCAPCYSGYEQALEQAGSTVVRHALRAEDGFQVTERILDDIDESIDAVFMANPNNPTSRCLPRDILLRVLDATAQRSIPVVLDECFIDLTQKQGSAELLADHPHLIIIKALTKTFALAGLRVGYALCSHASTIERLRAAGQMWAVSTPAQVAGVAVLSEQGYVEQARTLIAGERARLASALAEQGLHVIEGDANYVMFQGPNGLYDKFLEHGILIRRCENYHELDSTWYRIAVRTPEENNVFIAALQEVLA